MAAAASGPGSASPVPFPTSGGSGLLFLREEVWSSKGAVSAPTKAFLSAAIADRGKEMGTGSPHVPRQLPD